MTAEHISLVIEKHSLCRLLPELLGRQNQNERFKRSKLCNDVLNECASGSGACRKPES